MAPYTFLPEFTPLAQLGEWEGNLGDFTHVFGHSWLGHLFLWSPTGSYAIAYPYLARFKDYGPFPDPVAFRDTVLEDPYVTRAIFRSDLLGELTQRLGEPGPGEVLYPVPYEVLGGSGAPETYDRGSLREWARLVARVHGLPTRTE